MKIVVLDGYTLNPGDLSWDGVAAFGDLDVHDRTPPEEIVARAAGAEIILTNKVPLTAATIAQLPKLRFVQVLATGFDVIDIAAAAAAGIPVANVPAYATDFVAQHTLALLLELTNRVGEHSAAVREGAWTRSTDFCFWHGTLTELAGKTLGIIGFGRIGRTVAEVCGALGMRILAYNRSRRDLPCSVPVEWVALDVLCRRADVISLHCPATPENRGFIDASFLAAMKEGAFLINTARGALVDEAALAAALASGKLAGAAVDVVSTEPMRRDNPLLGAPNCVITPHIAWASVAARRRLMETVVGNLQAFLAGNPVHIVNGVAAGAQASS